ncbi:peptidoglycan-binding domain-containing protein [Polycladidibacter stylochi]|uniref:peptidoglycan-binding domain-containing protein n=1 Tax=Polycladidibacter stylochi TaxID=1807766 RepID=UPI00082DEA93|nr:peptidoglycan-binding domain-containing protein [Pseudovibrio stylochi]
MAKRSQKNKRRNAGISDGEVGATTSRPHKNNSHKIARPLPALAAAFFLIGGGYIAYNAMVKQPAHPAPFFVTRQGAAKNSHLITSGPQETQKAALQQQDLIRDIQWELRRLGIYRGVVDGKYGPATLKAIQTYERMRDYEVTGQATAGLLALLTMDPGKVPLKGAQLPMPRHAPGNEGQPLPIISGNDEAINTTGSIRQQANEPMAFVKQQLPTQHIKITAAKLRNVQEVLASMGYGPLKVDGIGGPSTQDAIEQFQRDRGLQPTGKVDENLIEELERVSGYNI